MNLFLIAFFITNACCFTSFNNIWVNTFIQNQTKGGLTVITKGRFGYTSVNFDNPTLPPISTILFLSPTSRVNFYQTIQNFSALSTTTLQESNKTISIFSNMVEKTFGFYMNEVEFSFTFPLEYANNNTLITLGIFRINLQ